MLPSPLPASHIEQLWDSVLLRSVVEYRQAMGLLEHVKSPQSSRVRTELQDVVKELEAELERRGLDWSQFA